MHAKQLRGISYSMVGFVALTAASSVEAQSNYGALRGIVTDGQGAVVSTAVVTLTSESTKIVRTTKSNSDGAYVFNAVEPGRYTVTVTGTGFMTVDEKGVVVDSGDTIPLDLKLPIGKTSDSVDVSAAEAVVNNGTSYNGQLIDAQKLENLPNPGRNPFLFSKLDNNVTPVGDPRFVRFQDQSGSSTISIAGAPLSSNNYSIDGVPITDFSNRAVIIPSIEAVEEVKVQANTYDAEIGRTSGGMFNTTLKSGSSVLHGVLQGETRQTNWGANLFFNNQTGTPRGAAEFYSYVGAIGGPIPLPGFLGGRDKTFFWITEEGYRQRSPITTNAFIVPTDQERKGDFSQIGAPSGATCNTGTDGTDKICPINPVTGAFFPNNDLSGSVNPVGSAILNYYPHANTGIATVGVTNFNGGDTLGDRADEFDGKLTHQFGTRWLADFYYLHYGSKEPGGNALTTVAGSSSSYLLYRKVDATSIQNTITLTPTTLLTVGFGFNRFPNNTVDISNGFQQSTLGFPANYTSALTKAAFPQITTDSSLSPEATANSGPAVYFSRNFVVGLSKSLGKHSLKTGYEYRAISVTFTNIANGNGTFAFDKTITGSTIADLYLGYPTSGSLVIPAKLAITTDYQGTYLQDDWRITPKLTLNMGVRYEYEPGVHERNNHYSVGFNRNVVFNAFGNGPQAKGGVEFAGVNGNPTTTGNQGSKVSPRGGFAYSIDPNTVVRGGYGLFYYPIVYSTSPNLAPGYVLTNSLTNSPGLASGLTSLSNPFPNVQTQPVGNVNGYSQNIGTTLSVIDDQRRAPLYKSYSADIEHQFPGGMALKVGYVGGHGHNLPNSLNINQIGERYLNSGQGAALNAAATSFPYAGIGSFGSLAKIKQYQTLLPFPQFQAITDSVSDGVSDYNALDVKFQKTFSQGVTVLATYTWASNWDNMWGASSTLNPNNNGPQDIYNLSTEYARAINDIPNRASVALTYELPFGHGKTFLGGANRWVDLAVGGWRFNDISIFQGGSPLPINQSTNVNSSFGNATTRPSLTGINPCYTGSTESRLLHYYNGAAYTATTVGNTGNAERTSNCYGPGYRNSDLSLNKDFRITERIHTEFRAEALNAFNTPQFNGPNLSADSKAYGQITSTLGFPRLIQLGGRLTF